MLRIDLVYHYIGGQVLNKGFEFLGLTTSDNAIVSTGIMVGKECFDKSFDVLDLGAGILGWLTML